MVASEKIADVARRIVALHKPDRIILFGSHANGSPRENSDVDLLVVLPDDGNPLRKAAEIRAGLDVDFPLDVIVRNAADLRWRLDQRDWFLLEVTQKGRVLYDAAHG